MRKTKEENIHSVLDPEKAKELFKRQIQKIDHLLTLNHDDPEIDAWENFTEQLIIQAFGKPSTNLDAYYSARHGGPIHLGMSENECQENYIRSREGLKKLFEGFIDQLELLDFSKSSEKTPSVSRQTIQNIYITQSQSQQIQQAINFDSLKPEIKDKTITLLDELAKKEDKNKSKIAGIIKWLADHAIEVLIAIISRRQ